MMRKLIVMTGALVVAACAHSSIERVETEELEREVRAAETAFAQTMADRDLEAFSRWIDDDAIFSVPDRTLRGKEEIVAAWSRFFEEETAPFSWRPDRVHVTQDGRLGATTGPVMSSAGEVVGRFASTWRRTPSGEWRVVVDMSPGCSCD